MDSPHQAAIRPQWSTGPSHPRLQGTEIHLWQVALDAVPAGARVLLSPAERARAARIVSPLRRARWIAGRVALRLLLGRYVEDTSPATLRITADRHGAPRLEHPAAPGFTLSHSGPDALLAFTAGAELGVDIQHERRPALLGRQSLAVRLFGPARAHELIALTDQGRAAVFLRAWVRREAWLKCGEGSSWTADLDLGPDRFGAIACERAPEALHCWLLEAGCGEGTG